MVCNLAVQLLLHQPAGLKPDRSRSWDMQPFQSLGILGLSGCTGLGFKNAEIAELGDANSLPDGAYIQMTSTGVLDGIPDYPIGRLCHTNTGAEISTTVDFSAVSPSSLTAEYYCDGELVYTEQAIGSNGPLWKYIHWPSSFDIKIRISGPPLRIRIKISFDWRTSISVLTAKGSQIAVDKVEVSPTGVEIVDGPSKSMCKVPMVWFETVRAGLYTRT